ncbi:MAG: CRISPR-associated helicase Cas3' [Chitinophagales bacterium]|jgi:CRISPR-associated endonuclease/helicase Cas3|nr:CRISPR-associated helicase Cas3' [Chitinophagales bacterium]
MENNFFDQFFAKSDGITTLEMHTQHVITAGKNLLKSLPFTPEKRTYWAEKLYRCAVLHDLGKIHSEFQRRLNGAKDVTIRHEIISLWFCENFLDLSEDELFAIATHHKGIMRTDAFKRLEMDALKAHMEEHLNSNINLLTKETLEKWLNLMNLHLPLKTQEIQPEISKQRIKILHYSHQSKIIDNNKERKELSLMRALMIASDHIGSARMENEVPTYKKIDLKDFQPKDKNKNLLSFRKFQENLQTITFDVILHAPTGSGKTEAALSWVYANQVENARLFYLLPYTASINAMVSRLQKVFGEERVTALHSKTLDFFYNQLADEESNDEKKEEKDYAKIQQEAKSKKFLSAELFYPVKVATLHQVLKTSLKGKGWELALYDYRNALFIIDEFHTYNALLTGMLLASIKLFRNLFNAKFFFMSATIPDFMLNIILNEVFDGNEKKIIRPNIEEASDKEILDRKRHILYCKEEKYVSDEITLIQDFLTKGKSVLVIVNNVKTAQKLYEEIDFTDKEKVKLLHSGFHKKDRTQIEESITNEDYTRRPQLLIATQAVEVSLDIDYDVAFIENAPIDALIQRLGRVNRAGKKGLAPIYLFENIIGNTPFYDNEVLKNTWNYLQTLDNQELSEQDLVKVCNQVYEKGYNENQQKDFEQGLKNTTIQDFETDWIAGDWNNWIEDIFEKNNQKIDVLCSNLLFDKWDGKDNTLGYDSLIKQKRYIEANQLFVSVYFYETNSKKDENREILISYDLEYDSKIGYKKKVDTFENVSL